MRFWKVKWWKWYRTGLLHNSRPEENMLFDRRVYVLQLYPTCYLILYDGIDEDMQAASKTDATGSIWSSISLKMGEKYMHYKSEEKRGSMVVKLEIYHFKDCFKKEKKEYTSL